MKNKVLLIGCFLSYGVANACEVCKKNQPKGLENITHGEGPSGTLDYIIIWTSVLIVVFTLVMSVKYLVQPKENNPDHIKHRMSQF